MKPVVEGPPAEQVLLKRAREHNGKVATFQQRSVSALKSFLAGGIAGSIAKTSVAPFERTKILMQVSQMYGWNSYKTVPASMKQIWKVDGFTGFFRGNTAAIARVFPYSATQFAAFEMYNRLLAKFVFGEDSKAPMKRLAAGAMAGATSVLCTYPLDLIRTKLAVRVGPTQSISHGLVQAVKKTIKEEGLSGMYKGMYPTLVGVMPYAGSSFFAFGIFRRYADNKGFKANPSLITSICGACAGLSAQVVTYPIDVIRRRRQAMHSPQTINERERRLMQAAVSGRSGRFSVARAIFHIFQVEGFTGLYRGLSINFVKSAPSMAISFTAYDFLKRAFGVPPGKYSATVA